MDRNPLADLEEVLPRVALEECQPVPQIADRVKMPVIAAGGIADGRGIAAALTLGTDAVQIGTAFFACEESGATKWHRDLLFRAETRHTGLSRTFTGRYARGIYNRFSEEMKPMSRSWPGTPHKAGLSPRSALPPTFNLKD